MVTCHNYDHITTSINLTTLEYRRKVFDVSFVRKALYGPITYSDIIEKFKVNVPFKNLRYSELLRVEYHRTLQSYDIKYMPIVYIHWFFRATISLI